MRKLVILSILCTAISVAAADTTLFDSVHVQNLTTTQDFAAEPNVTPPVLGAVVNSYAPTGWATHMHWHLQAAPSGTKITGFAALTGEQWRLLMNISNQDISIADLDPGEPIAVDRVHTPSGLPLVIPTGGSILMHYENATSLWYVIAQAGPPVSTFTPNGSPAQNLWIGGGGAHFVGGVFPGTGQNTSYGLGALASATTGNQDTCIGSNACNSITTGYTTTAVGVGVLQADTTGVDNTCIGYLSAINLTTGSTNTAVGTETLSACTTCGANVAIGISAGQLLTTGTDDVAIGHQSTCGTTGSDNTCVGSHSGAGIQGSIADIAIGPFTLQAATSANANVAVGTTSLTAATTGANNTAVGAFASTGVITGSENTAVGDHANGTGGDASYDTAIGAFALQLDSGGFNVAVGYLADASNTTGVANTVVGYNASTGITTGNANTIIGANVAGLAAGTSSNVILADGFGHFRFNVDANASITFDQNDATKQTIMIGTAPTSASHGTLSADASNFVGRITTIGSNTSTTLTFGGGGFANTSHCSSSIESSGAGIGEIIIITPSKTAPVFSCFDSTTAAAANCPNFSYFCWGN